MIIRTFYATIEISCCRDGDIIYRPLPRVIEAPQTKDVFKDSLVIWGDKAEKAVYNKYYQMAELECIGMGATPRLCLFNMRNIKIKEVLVPEVPQDVIDRIARDEQYILVSKGTIERIEADITEIMAKEKLTVGDRTELRRLNRYLEMEKKTIKRLREDIRYLKEKWNIK